MKWRRDLVAVAAIVLLAAAVGLLPQAERLRVGSVDLLFLLRSLATDRVKASEQPSPVAVIAIDEETYRSPPFQDTPNALWTRDIAKVLNALVAADAKVVGFDIVYPTSIDRFIPGFDRDFLLALRAGSQREKVVLGKVQHQTQPIAPFAGQRVAVGGERNIRSLNLLSDADDIVRRIPLLFGAADGTSEPGIALELARRGLGTTVEKAADGIRLGAWTIPGSADENAHINFRRGAIPTYSLHDLVACLDINQAADFFRNQFAGKTLLFGTLLDVEDRKVTSMRWITEPEGPATGARCATQPRNDLFDSDARRDSIPGVLIHATAVRNLMEQDVLAPAPGWAQHLADLLLALIGASLAMGFKPLRAALILGAALLLWSGVAATALAGGLILPVIMPAVTAAMALAATLGWRFVVSDRDKRFLRDSFALYLAPALVDRLVDGANPPALGGEEREVTLFFSDLAGFSTMSEGLKPEETVRIMNAYLGAMTEEIERAGGMVDKYIGDAIVALFGAPLAAADHGRRAVAAALACRARLALLNQSLGRMKEPLRQRIGLNSGSALIGNIGSDRRFNYTAMGDTVNLAARLEGANKVFGTDILVSESTASGAPDVTWRELDHIRVVGRAKPVAVLTPVFPGEEKLAEAYAAALAAFRNRDFARTIALAGPFAAMDKASAGLIKRAEAFLTNPPPADWQPVNELTEK